MRMGGSDEKLGRLLMAVEKGGLEEKHQKAGGPHGSEFPSLHNAHPTWPLLCAAAAGSPPLLHVLQHARQLCTLRLTKTMRSKQRSTVGIIISNSTATKRGATVLNIHPPIPESLLCIVISLRGHSVSSWSDILSLGTEKAE